MNDCLVIIDVQTGFISENTKAILPKIEALLNSKDFKFVVATQFVNKPNSPYEKFLGWKKLQNSPETDLYDTVARRADRVFKKDIYSCFTQEFEDYIKENNIEKLFFLGIDTDCCVLKSATDCFERNIPFEVLINYCSSNGGEESHEAAIAVMKRTIGNNQINNNI